MLEEWRDAPGFEGRLQVSSYGRVRSLRVLSVPPTSTGYRAMKFAKERQRYVHELVAAAFIGVRPVGYDVNHKDGNKLNNCPENLEYITRKANVHHAFRLGLLRHKLTESQMDAISDMYFAEGCSFGEIAKRVKAHRNVVRSVIGIWRARDRKGRVNPYEFKLDDDKAFKIVTMYADGAAGLTQAQVAAAFNVHPAHVSRVVSGKLWPEARKRYCATQTTAQMEHVRHHGPLRSK